MANALERKSLRLIVIDDSATALDALCEFLAVLPGVQVVGIGSNGLEAVQLVDQLRPDLVLMDMRMPKMDGIRATQQIRTQFSATNVILMSTSNAGAALREQIEGLALFICKSDLAERLPDAIAHLFPNRAIVD